MLGMIGGLIGIVALFPQILKVLRTRNVEGLSLAMWLISVTSRTLWFLHGLSVGDSAIVMTNGSFFVLESTVVVCILAFGSRYVGLRRTLSDALGRVARHLRGLPASVQATR